MQGSLKSEGGKECDLPVALASKVSEGRHDFCYRGVVLLALLNSVVCFIALPRHLHLFYGNFWSPAVQRLTGAAAFFPCQMANDSGLEPNSQLFFSRIGIYPFHLAIKPLDVEQWTQTLHMLCLSYPVASASEHSVRLEQLVHAYVREAVLVLPQCNTELFFEV